MNRRTKVVLGCIALLALTLLACGVDNWDGMDRDEWAWDGSDGYEPVAPTLAPIDVEAQARRPSGP